MSGSGGLSLAGSTGGGIDALKRAWAFLWDDAEPTLRLPMPMGETSVDRRNRVAEGSPVTPRSGATSGSPTGRRVSLDRLAAEQRRRTVSSEKR